MKGALLALGLIAAPIAVWACDPEEMERAMTEICQAAAEGAEVAIAAALPRATAEEAETLASGLATLRRGCVEGDPVVAVRQAPALARMAGRIEARPSQAARHIPNISPQEEPST